MKKLHKSNRDRKISGVCGRLMCCLKYEQDHYEQTRKMMPRIGKEVSTPDGTGIVSDLNIVKETVFVRITNGDSSEIKEYSLEKVEKNTGSESHQPTEKKENEAEKEKRNLSSSAETDSEADTGNDSKGNDSPSKNANRGKKAQNNSSAQNRNQRKSEKQETVKKNPVLGKPVMRENPNRNVPQQEEIAPDSEMPERKSQQTSGSTWAEAVRKAIDSIN